MTDTKKVECSTCKFCEQSPTHPWLGTCTFKFPRSVRMDPAYADTTVRNDDSCDLHIEKE